MTEELVICEIRFTDDEFRGHLITPLKIHTTEMLIYFIIPLLK